MLFRRLDGRQVLVNYDTGEAFRGTVVGRGLFTVRLSAAEGIYPNGQTTAMQGSVRLIVRRITWIQEL